MKSDYGKRASVSFTQTMTDEEWDRIFCKKRKDKPVAIGGSIVTSLGYETDNKGDEPDA